MSNGDPLRVGLSQPPDNRATSATMLVHNGSAFGTQTAAFWVQRLGAPVANAAIRGENFSSGATDGLTFAGVLGMVQPQSAGVGVLGTTAAGPQVLWGEVGVMGVTNTFGVVGKGLSGLVVDNGQIVLASTGVVGQSDDGVGVHGIAAGGFGIIGESSARAGVTGTSTSGVGIDGTSTQGTAGVHGSSPARAGVFGESSQGVGLLGMAPGNAIQGISGGPAAASIGVVGLSTTGSGVLGDSAQGVGVTGRSSHGTAGLFVGPVVVQGSLFVTGAKHAAIKGRDGARRAVFCVESAEGMLEDLGEVRMTGAIAKVRFARDFAPLIRRSGYQVFLTSYGPDAVYVRRRGRDGFEIARVGDATRALTVGYRIVARRADLKAERLPKVRLPTGTAKVTRLDLAAPRAAAKAVGLPRAPKLPSPDLKRLAAESQRARQGTRKPR